MITPSILPQPFSIGQLIKEELYRQERTVTWLARKINCDRRNVYNVFERTYVDTELLLRISIALQTDFFVYYSRALQSIENQKITPPAIRRLSGKKAVPLGDDDVDGGVVWFDGEFVK